MKPSVKAVLVPALALTSTAAITYAVPEIINEKSTATTEDSLKLEVKRVDSDTVKVSLNNVEDIPRSIQFSVKLDGVVPKDGQASIKDLITQEIKSRQASGQNQGSATGILTDFTYNESDNTIDVLVTSNQSLPKVGNKIEVFELDIKKADDNMAETYKVLPHNSAEYKYVSVSNKEYNELGVVHDNQDIQMEIAPKISSAERYLTITEGATLTADTLKSKLGIQLTHEDGEDDLELEITRNNQVITEFTENTPGLYELQLKAVKGNKKSEAMTIQINVELDHVKTLPTITRNNEALTDITLDGGSKFVPLENVKAVDAKGRPVEVSVTVDKELDLDPDQDTDYVFTYTATDIYGNKAEESMTLTVVANQAPVISGVKDHTIKVGDTFDPKAGVTVKDDKDQDIELKVEGEVNTQLAGSYKISYSATDSGGKTTRAQSTVTVNPKPTVLNSIPVITATDVTIKVGDTFDPKAGVTAEDKEDGILTDKVEVIENTVLNSIPVITATDVTIKVGDTFDPKAGVTAEDKEDGILTDKVEVIENTVDTTKPGTYTVTYQVKDSQGATAKKQITVKVNPKPTALNSIPVITATDVTIKVGDTFDPKAGVTAEDKEDGILTDKVEVIENTVLNSIPVITATDVTIKVGDTFDPKAGVTAEDKEDGILTDKVEVIENTVNSSVAGEYVVKYRVTDSGGATTIKVITVTVKSNLTLATSITINNKDENKLYLDGTKTITASVNDEADLKGIEWEVSDQNIVELNVVQNEARILAKAEGEVTLIAKTTDGSQLSDTMTIKVSKFENNDEIPTYVKEVIDTTVLIPISGSSDKESPLELEVKDVNADQLDGVITNLKKLNYQIISVTKTDGFTIYQVKISNKRSFLTLEKSVDEAYIFIKVSETLANADEINQKLTQLVDNTAQTPNTKPTISISGLNTNLTVGDSFDPLQGVTAFDAEEGDLTQFITVNGKVDTTKAGSYTLTYVVKDSQGEEVSMTVTIIVAEKLETPEETPNTPEQNKGEKPVITVTSSINTITVGDKFDPLAGVQAYDKEDGDLTNKIKVLGEVNLAKAGDYQLTYTVEDSDGNVITFIRILTVVEKTSVKEENSSNPQTGYTGVLGYLGLAATAVGGVLLSKRKKK